VAVVAVAAAADPTETSTFGKDGIARQSLGVHFEETQFSSVVARGDGGLVAQREDQVESFLADGAPDPAAPARQVSKYRELFLLASGKSLVLDEEELTRVNPDGSVDTSFGGTGTIEVSYGVQAASELPSGKILIVSTNSGGTHVRFASVSVELLNPDGSFGRGIGADSTLTLSLPAYEETMDVPEIALTGDGGALVVGGGFLLELRADGSPNPGFGSDGLVTGLPNLVGARVLPDGSVEAVGWAPQGSGKGQDLAVLHYTAAGKPDPTFGPEGIRRFDFGGWENAYAASWAADGSVIVGGRSEALGPCPREEGCEEVPLLAAFDPAGNLDSSFGQGGVLRLMALAATPAGLRSSGALALTRRPDGSIVAAGDAAPNRTVAFLAAFSPEGGLLPGFGEGGIVRLRRPVPATQQLVGFAPLASGKLLAAGTTDLGIDDQPVLIRYAADGSLDPSFGGGAGYVVVGRSRSAMGFAADGSGQVLMGHYAYPRSRLLRLSAADGAPVRSFGSNGAVLLPSRIRVAALGFAGDGDAVVLGIHDIGGTAEPGVALRYRPNGKPDPAFGHDGRLPLRLPGGEEVEGRALIAGTGGRILIGGMAGRRFAITRLLPGGRSEPRFGSGGWSLVSAGGVAKSLTLSRAGSRIYLAGVANSEGHLHVVLMRFDGDGRLDPTFGHRGRLTAPISKPAQPKAIVPTSGGVLVVLSGGPRPLLSFCRDGKVRRHWVGSHSQFVSNVRAIVSRGRLVLGLNGYSYATGSKAFYGHEVFYLARRPLGGDGGGLPRKAN